MGICTVITAFNFPAAVWSWNASLALVCGNAVIWKPSEKTPLTALAVDQILADALTTFGDAPEGLTALVTGSRVVSEKLVSDPRSAIVSATGSTEMGRAVGVEVACRFGCSLLELGGNNAGIVSGTADLELALRGILFSAVGTAGQRCTTLRRLFVHESVYDTAVGRLKMLYDKVSIGNPLEHGTLMGPLIGEQSFLRMQAALDLAKRAVGKVHGGERHIVAGGEHVQNAFVQYPRDLVAGAQGFHVSHDPNHVDSHGAAVHATAATGADPGERRFHDFVHHAEGQHADDFAGVETLQARSAGSRTPVGARSAGKAKT